MNNRLINLRARCQGRAIVLFGASKIGYCVLKVLKMAGLSPVCYCDNDSCKQGTKQDGLPVLSPGQAIAQHKNPYFFLCLLSRKNQAVITAQLSSIGVSDVESGCDILYLYHTLCMGRPESPQYLHCFMEENERDFTLEHVLVILTNKCTLNCRDCGHLIPHYTSPGHYNFELILNSIIRLAESVDRINLLSLVGGEPLLYPDLARLCQELGRIPNIKMIRIITNGTLVPDADALKAIHDNISFVIISNYGTLSSKADILMKKMDEFRIAYERLPVSGFWYPVGLPLTDARNPSEAQKLFDTCSWGRGCSAIQNGEYHLCNYSSTVNALGIMASPEEDYVNLLDYSMDSKELSARLQAFIDRKIPIACCSSCNFDFTRQVTPAVQQARRKPHEV